MTRPSLRQAQEESGLRSAIFADVIATRSMRGNRRLVGSTRSTGLRDPHHPLRHREAQPPTTHLPLHRPQGVSGRQSATSVSGTVTRLMRGSRKSAGSTRSMGLRDLHRLRRALVMTHPRHLHQARGASGLLWVISANDTATRSTQESKR